MLFSDETVSSRYHEVLIVHTYHLNHFVNLLLPCVLLYIYLPTNREEIPCHVLSLLYTHPNRLYPGSDSLRLKHYYLYR